ncbi:hypothetical protein JH146_1469 [Methanocaldococcus bathoardescens]|uniref:Uncharacterized protein n=1 Tax=Methanocaldococcus bathoardescens TaxID=1301915 RepID=A0A076LDL0_9EURY|nr:DUF5402 family protein [Methanocaldococcus bathoardescens]AIJ06311.1 hypothetical protein JH146_1469 [Methanocaldococcus bathoardescens]
MKNKILNDREEIEKFFIKLLGREIFISEMDVFASKCSCVGIMLTVRGLFIDDVEIFKEKILNKLEDLAKSYNIGDDWIFIRVLPGSDDVINIGVRELCDICREEYKFKKPRPDLISLKI